MRFFVQLICCLFSSFCLAAVPMPPEQAFKLHAQFTRSHQLALQWQIAPHYYLYAKRLVIKLEPNVALAAPIVLPQGELKYFADTGRQEVFTRNLTIPISINSQNTMLKLHVSYQGCAQDGFCYPPVSSVFSLNVPLQEISAETRADPVSISLGKLLSDQQGVHALLLQEHKMMLLLIFLGLGLLLALTPCVWPMIPILAGIILQGQQLQTRKAVLLSLTYVLGSATTYALAGMLAVWMGSSLQVWLQQPVVIGITSLLFGLLAFSLLGAYEIKLPRSWDQYWLKQSQRQRSGAYAGVFAMGLIATLIVSPCVTAPLVGVLLYISQSGELWFGASALFAMGIGMGIPLLMIGAALGTYLPRSGVWMEVIKRVMGLLMIAMAIWLIGRIVSNIVILFVWGTFLIGIALYLLVFLPRLLGASLVNKLLAYALGLGGLLMLCSSLIAPQLLPQWIVPSPSPDQFVRVHDTRHLQQKLSAARAARQPVILDFYADWCESCLTMDRTIFQAPDVKRLLSGYLMLRVDVTAYTKEDARIMQRLKVIAPPTVIFFDEQGQEISSKRIVGEVNKKEFFSRLNTSN